MNQARARRQDAVIALRLPPGADLRRELTRVPRDHGITAAFILSAVGSLGPAAIRFAGKQSATLLEGDFEIIAFSGTLGPDGVHLHIAVADAEGRVLGGHVAEGCVVRTTVELVIGIAQGWTFNREPDPATGYRELVPRKQRR